MKHLNKIIFFYRNGILLTICTCFLLNGVALGFAFDSSQLKSEQQYNGTLNKVPDDNFLLKHTVDSLSQQLSLISEDSKHYDNNLTQQTAIFIGIITIVTGLIGLISYKFIIDKTRKSINEIKKEFDLQKIEFENQKLKSEINEFHLNRSMSNTYIVIAIICRKDNDPKNAFKFYLSAAVAISRSYLVGIKLELKTPKIEKDIKESKKNLVIDLNNANENLKLLIGNKFSVDQLLTEKNDFIRQLDEILRLDDEEVKNLSSEIRTDLLRYLDSTRTTGPKL